MSDIIYTLFDIINSLIKVNDNCHLSFENYNAAKT